MLLVKASVLLAMPLAFLHHRGTWTDLVQTVRGNDLVFFALQVDCAQGAQVELPLATLPETQEARGLPPSMLKRGPVL